MSSGNEYSYKTQGDDVPQQEQQQSEMEYGIPSNGNASPTPERHGEATKSQMVGAAVAVGVVGSVVATPLLGVAAAAGAAYGATQSTKAGEVTRAVGDATANAGSKVKEWNEKHKVTEKTSNAIVGAGQWVSKQINKSKNNNNDNNENNNGGNGPVPA